MIASCDEDVLFAATTFAVLEIREHWILACLVIWNVTSWIPASAGFYFISTDIPLKKAKYNKLATKYRFV